MKKKYYVTWQDIQEFVNDVAIKYQNTKFTGVYGFPRGGLIIAVMLSYKMGLPLLTAPCENCLIIDDICDTGESLLHYVKRSCEQDNNGNHQIATLYYKPNYLNIVPDYYKFIKKDEWIVFPWEE